jgi:hypothetical protein
MVSAFNGDRNPNALSFLVYLLKKEDGNEYFALRYVHQAMLSQNKELTFKHLFFRLEKIFEAMPCLQKINLMLTSEMTGVWKQT